MATAVVPVSPASSRAPSGWPEDDYDPRWDAAPVVEMKLGVDAEKMKAQVKEYLLRPQYNVCDLYHKTGIYQQIARSTVFDNMTLLIIAFNAVWIAVDTDFNHQPVLIKAAPIFQIAEHFFCTYFSFEIAVRYCSFKRKRDCVRDAWFIFDCTLVLLMVADTWVMTAIMLLSSNQGGSILGNAAILRLARLMRLSRMARMVRLFRAMPELLMLIKGMVAATRSVFFTLCLNIILLYVFGVAIRQVTDGTDIGTEAFATVPSSMYTLLIQGCFLDSLGSVARPLAEESLLGACFWWAFVLLSTLTVMNMLIGVLCEVVSAVAATEKEALVVSFTKEKMGALFDDLDESGDGYISKDEFLKILQKPEAARLLEEVGVDVVGLIDQADAIFMDHRLGEEFPSLDEGEQPLRELSFVDLMGVILELRGSNHASVKHIVELRKYVLQAIAQTNRALARLEVQIAARHSTTERRRSEYGRARGSTRTCTEPVFATPALEAEVVDANTDEQDSAHTHGDAQLPARESKGSLSSRGAPRLRPSPTAGSLASASSVGQPWSQLDGSRGWGALEVENFLVEEEEAPPVVQQQRPPPPAAPVAAVRARQPGENPRHSGGPAQICHPFGLGDRWATAPPPGDAPRAKSPSGRLSGASFAILPHAHAAPEGVEFVSLVDRLELLAAEARTELQRELGRCLPLPPPTARGSVASGGAGERGGAGGSRRSGFGQPTAHADGAGATAGAAAVAGHLQAFGRHELEVLRSKLAAVVGTVAGVAELRSIQAQVQLEVQEEERDARKSAPRAEPPPHQ